MTPAAAAAEVLARFAGRVVVLDVDIATGPDAVILHIRPYHLSHIGGLTRHLAITGTDLTVVELHSGHPTLERLADSKRTRLATLPKPHGGHDDGPGAA